MRTVWSSIGVVLLWVPCSGAESPPANCQGTETFRYKVQVSINGGTTWYTNGMTVCAASPGQSFDIAVRTLMTVTSGQTQGWSFSLRHNAPWTSQYGGSFSLTGVTTNGTNTATVQNGSPPDTNHTAVRSGGFTQGIVIDSDTGITLGPTTDFVTARACYRVTAPWYWGTYTITLKFTHDVGTPPVRSVITQQGESNIPCATNFTLYLQVSGCYPHYIPPCTIPGAGAPAAAPGSETVVIGEVLPETDAQPEGTKLPEPGVVLGGAGGGNTHIDFTRRIPPDRDIPADPVEGRPSNDIRATPDGRFFVFSSMADFNIPEDPNAPPPNPTRILWVYRAAVDDRNVATIDLVSRSILGQPAFADCFHPSISSDGQVVAFATFEGLDTNRDNNQFSDVYVRDFRVSLDDCPNPPCTRLISAVGPGGLAGNNNSMRPCVSPDGNVVVFNSLATDLVTAPVAPGDTMNVYRMDSGPPSPPVQMEMVSVDDVEPVGPCSGGPPGNCQTFDSLGKGKVLNTNGTLIVFQGSPQSTLFQLQQPSTCSTGPFQSIQVFLRDLRDPANRRTFVASAVRPNGQVFCGDANSLRPSISANGLRIVFHSSARNLIVNDLNPGFDVFAVDVAQVTANAMAPVLISVNSQGAQPTSGTSDQAIVTDDGTHVVFRSFATTLDNQPPDTNDAPDIFVRHLEAGITQPGITRRMNLDAADNQANVGSSSSNPDIFLGGRGVIYQSTAINLLNLDQDAPFFLPIPDTNGFQDVFESRLKAEFIRGDVNSSGGPIDISDPIFLLSALFLDGANRPECVDSADANADERVDISDPIFLLAFLFLGSGQPPPAPFPGCGFDPTDDLLSCRRRGVTCPPDPLDPGLHSHE